MTPPEEKGGAALEAVVRAIREEGPITCERYMELALYRPGAGYYRRGIRPPRDYVTAPEVSPLFGRLLGRLAARAGTLIPGEAPLVVLEPGAGDGALAEAAAAAPELAPLVAEGRALWVASDLSYAALPPGRSAGFAAVACAGLSAFRPIPRGLVVANELLDALPCRVAERVPGGWREVRVGLAEGRPAETTTPLDDPELAAHLGEAWAGLPEGGRVEVCLRARDFLREASRLVARGLAVLIDYGGTREELAERADAGGTLRAFSGHSVLADPFLRPGSVDLTADVNFSDLARWAVEAGWEIVACSSQRDTLLSLGLLEEVAALAREVGSPERLKRYLAAKRFLLEEGLQERVRVLVLGRGLDRDASRAGEHLGLLAPG